MLLAILYTWAAWRLPRFQMSTVVDAHVFPVVVGLVLMVLSVWLWAQKPTSTFRPDGLVVPLLIGLLMLAYALALEPVGFVLSTSVFVVATSALLGWRRWLSGILVAVLFSVGTYFIFVRLLSVPLPAGLLPWLGV